MRERISVRFDLDEVSGADVDQDVGGVVESGGDVEGGGEGDEDSVGRRAHGEVVEGGGRDLEARGGAANVVDCLAEDWLPDRFALSPPSTAPRSSSPNPSNHSSKNPSNQHKTLTKQFLQFDSISIAIRNTSTEPTP